MRLDSMTRATCLALILSGLACARNKTNDQVGAAQDSTSAIDVDPVNVVRLDRAQRVRRRHATLLDQVEQGAGIGVKHRLSCVVARRPEMIADRPGGSP